MVKRLQDTLAAYQASMYTGGMDKAKTPEDEYCDFVRREKWLRPYDDDPPPPPSPPPSPLPPASVHRINGTWVQNWADASADGGKPEWMAISVDVRNALAVKPLNCTGCCWSRGSGSAAVGKTTETLQLVATGASCTRTMAGTLRDSQKYPLGLAIEWSDAAAAASGAAGAGWADWVKIA